MMMNRIDILNDIKSVLNRYGVSIELQSYGEDNIVVATLDGTTEELFLAEEGSALDVKTIDELIEKHENGDSSYGLFDESLFGRGA